MIKKKIIIISLIFFLTNCGFTPIYLNNTDVNKIKLDNCTYFESNKMCGYSFSPCTHYKDKKLKSKKYYGYKIIIND